MKFQINHDFLNQSKKKDATIGNSLLKNDLSEANTALLGYPDDKGIDLNGGTTGAKEAPSIIRKHFFKMTPDASVKEQTLYDIGDLQFDLSSSLEERHSAGSQKVKETLENENIKKMLTFGGGHDYGYADGEGFAESLNSDDPIYIFNFDAHFDLRDLSSGITSGTPFYRLAEKYKERLNLFELGIQKQCNSESLYDYANTHPGITTINYEKLFPENIFSSKTFEDALLKHSSSLKKPKCFVSVDIDGFSSAYAPGCSQSWPTGFDLASFFHLFDLIHINFDIQLLGIYEVSPPLDNNHQTSRLASMIAYRYLEL